jgi:hypothetical protein
MEWGHERRCRRRSRKRAVVRDLRGRDLVLPGGLTMENVILSIGAIAVMVYLLVARIRPEKF